MYKSKLLERIFFVLVFSLVFLNFSGLFVFSVFPDFDINIQDFNVEEIEENKFITLGVEKPPVTIKEEKIISFFTKLVLYITGIVAALVIIFVFYTLYKELRKTPFIEKEEKERGVEKEGREEEISKKRRMTLGESFEEIKKFFKK